MRLLCILLPPVAVLFCGKPIQALINVLLTCLFWIPGIIHAWGIVTDSREDKKHRQMVDAVRSTGGTGPNQTTESKSGGFWKIWKTLYNIFGD